MNRQACELRSLPVLFSRPVGTGVSSARVGAWRLGGIVAGVHPKGADRWLAWGATPGKQVNKSCTPAGRVKAGDGTDPEAPGQVARAFLSAQ